MLSYIFSFDRQAKEVIYDNFLFYTKSKGQALMVSLVKLVAYLSLSYDSQVDTFFIDPDVTNPRARHVYEKAGFKYIDDFIMEGDGVFAGRKTHFLVKRL